MSSYEQRKEPWSKEWQYLLFAAEPYVRSTSLFLFGVGGSGREPLRKEQQVPAVCHRFRRACTVADGSMAMFLVCGLQAKRSIPAEQLAFLHLTLCRR